MDGGHLAPWRGGKAGNPPTALTAMDLAHPSAALPRRRLPIGIQTLAKLRGQDCYYVEKSGLAVDLIESGSYFFLSRPRRFGKSLLVDTFKELFEGNRALSAGLAAQSRWDWSQRFPVVRLSFSDGVLRSRAALDDAIHELLQANEERLGVHCARRSVTGRLAELIQRVREHHDAPVVVLVDEYDKPILDNLSEPAIASDMREGLRNLYSLLKGADEHLNFVFLTGVSKFSKVSLFSGLNNLRDITLDARWSALCGYTDADIDSVFAPELPGPDRDETSCSSPGTCTRRTWAGWWPPRCCCRASTSTPWRPRRCCSRPAA